ncbi:MAG: type II secretion system F family protein [Candidatus Lambdaproteobacteria bacterium]|nr:type II secretion system F family protein [Candidatus Lambdaproteobacteria bacterium]
MTIFAYRALGASGNAEKGTLNAPNLNEALSILRARDIYPIEVKPTEASGLSQKAARVVLRRTGLSVSRLAAFARQFATLAGATVPYDQALGMILEQTPDLRFKSVLSDVRSRIMEGAYLADAFAAQGRYFPPMMINLIRSGEASGNLDRIMNRLADYYSEMHRLQTRVAASLVYPAFMMLFSLAVVIFMLTNIIPKITVLFENFNATLPLPTRILIAVSELITGYWWALLPALIVAVWGLLRFLRTGRGALLKDRLMLSLPYWRNVQRQLLMQRFTQTLATLLSSGVEMKNALSISRDVMENRIYLAAMDRVIFDVQNKGLSVSMALRRTALFPEDVVQMVAIGEETATLPQMLEHVATRIAQEMSATMEAATALIEPVMILVMGLVVGFIVMSILLPMLQLNQLVR